MLAFIADLQLGKMECCGAIETSIGHEVTKATKQHAEVALALHHVVQTHFDMDSTEVAVFRLAEEFRLTLCSRVPIAVASFGDF